MGRRAGEDLSVRRALSARESLGKGGAHDLDRGQGAWPGWRSKWLLLGAGAGRSSPGPWANGQQSAGRGRSRRGDERRTSRCGVLKVSEDGLRRLWFLLLPRPLLHRSRGSRTCPCRTGGWNRAEMRQRLAAGRGLLGRGLGAGSVGAGVPGCGHSPPGRGPGRQMGPLPPGACSHPKAEAGGRGRGGGQGRPGLGGWLGGRCTDTWEGEACA